MNLRIKNIYIYTRTDDKITKLTTKKLTAQKERPQKDEEKRNIFIICGIMNKIKRFIEMQAKSKLFNKSFFGTMSVTDCVYARSRTGTHTHIQLRELNISPLQAKNNSNNIVSVVSECFVVFFRCAGIYFIQLLE